MDIIRATPDELAQWFVADLAREIRAAAARPGRAERFTLAVPGGSVAARFFPHLASAPVDWDRVELFWADERAVPPTAPDSNYALAERLWLRPAGISPARVHRMPAERDDHARAAQAYAQRLAAAAGSPPVLDYVLVGVGEDGHVASVLPGHEEAFHGTGPVVWTDRAPKPPSRRMTLTLETLAAARRVVVAAFDATKAPVVADALREPDATTPVAVLLRTAKRAVLLLGHEVTPIGYIDLKGR